METTRPHGISSMALAPDGRKLYALSTDSRCVRTSPTGTRRKTEPFPPNSIYAFDPTNLTHSAPLTTFHTPLARYSSFYIRCAVSPCSRFLASGSSDGSVFVWDTEGRGGPEEVVRLVGHEAEVSGLDWAHESVGFALLDPPPSLQLFKRRNAYTASLSTVRDVLGRQPRPVLAFEAGCCALPFRRDPAPLLPIPRLARRRRRRTPTRPLERRSVHRVEDLAYPPRRRLYRKPTLESTPVHPILSPAIPLPISSHAHLTLASLSLHLEQVTPSLYPPRLLLVARSPARTYHSALND